MHRHSSRLNLACTLLATLLLVPIGARAQQAPPPPSEDLEMELPLGTFAVPISEDKITVRLTTPDAREFDVTTFNGGLIRIQNTDMDRFASGFLLRLDEESGDVKALPVKIFKHASKQGEVVRLPKTEPSQLHEEEIVVSQESFVASENQYMLSLVSVQRSEGGDAREQAAGVDSLTEQPDVVNSTMCCVQCGPYVICGCRVVGCGGSCCSGGCCGGGAVY